MYERLVRSTLELRQRFSAAEYVGGISTGPVHSLAVDPSGFTRPRVDK